MKKFILGQKLEMSQIFNKEGEVIPVTLLKVGPCKVLQIKKKDSDKDGYNAVQIGFKELKPKKVKKPLSQKPFQFIREFREDISEYKTGDQIDISIFNEGEKVKISGISKGKGFQGVVKRWGFKGKGGSHGVKHEARKGGSIGSRYPQRVLKGRKMAGRMGSERITVKNLKIVKIDKENNMIAVKGAVPGRRGTLIEIRG